VTTKRRPSGGRYASRSSPAHRSQKSAARPSTTGAGRSAGPRRGASTPKKSRSAKSGPASARSAISVLSEHAVDLWALALATIGVLGAIALYGDSLGPVGHGVRQIAGDLLGTGRFVLTPACLVAGVLLVAGRSAEREPVRVGIGLVVSLWAVAGLAAAAGGAPSFTASHLELAGAGGWLGAAACNPLEAGLGVLGASVVLIAILGCALIVLTGISVRSAALGIAAFSRFSWQYISRAAKTIGSVGEVVIKADTTPTSPHASSGQSIFDVDEALSRDRPDDVPVDMDLVGTSRLHGDDESEDAVDGRGSEQPGSSSLSGHDAESGVAAASRMAPGPAGSGSQRATLPARQLELELGLATGQWRLPHVGILARSRARAIDRGEIAVAGRALVDALTAHGVDTRLVGHTVGPTVTRYELELGPGVKVARVTSLAKDIAYAMASPDVRILAPIPGKSAIGIEVPNRQRQLVTLGDVLSSEEARKAAHPLEVALGRDIAGRPVMANLADMPHILISGATGAGKSSCINSLLTSILVRSTPEQVRLILVDPKRVELGQYNGLPHLLTQVVVDPKKAANALNWAVAEMERRYDLLAEVGMRDITGYNTAIDRGELGPPHGNAQEPDENEAGAPGDAGALTAGGPPGARAPGAAGVPGAVREAGDKGPVTYDAEGFDEDDEDGLVDSSADGADGDAGRNGQPAGPGRHGRHGEMTVAARVAEVKQAVESKATEHSRLPFVLVVVDELNDLMMVAARDVEESVCRIAQMARAVGIHLVLATQRPSVDVITGVIKANIPSRLAFSVSSLADSRVILDQPGAERLIGKGDMLLLTASSSVPRRIQGPWVTEEEVRAVVAHWRRQSQPEYVSGIEGENLAGPGPAGMPGDDDEYLTQAMELVVRSQLGSTSMLQRKLRVGFSRAGRLMDLLERRGVVGPSEGSKARSVLMTVDELDQMLGSID
jgi:DNA segregation ATPase FtsK/SpoIIIE, S-DNA-T family